MKKYGQIICLLLVGILLVTFVGCSTNSSAETASETTVQQSSAENEPAEEKESKEIPSIKIGWAPPEISDVYEIATRKLEESLNNARALGFEVEVVQKSTANHTPADQIQVIENLVESGIDVLMLCVSDWDSLTETLKEVNEAGIPIVLVNQIEEAPGVEIYGYIGFDNASASACGAWNVIDALGGPGFQGEGETVDVPAETYLNESFWEDLYKDFDVNQISGKIALIDGVAGTTFSNIRADGFKSVISRFPNVEIISELPGDWDRQTGMEAAENILQNNDDLDAIYACCAEMGIGAYMAVENAGRLDDVQVFCQDGLEESMKYVSEGKIKGDSWHGIWEWCWYGAEYCVRAALDLEPESQVFDVHARSIILPNVDQFYPEPQLEEIDWQTVYDEAAAKYE